ncbi:hypothetical protein I7I51_02138 [Histoplasma capsulatum]|uniref:Uncharacterized protein n=1 Tax=Ajellomyces capsulatus TaxID=5037 RepID=A0A8A1M8V1_AJECA|nr:hypothetical protein I7I51_02138 [Histoplasma capsulatum]
MVQTKRKEKAKAPSPQRARPRIASSRRARQVTATTIPQQQYRRMTTMLGSAATSLRIPNLGRKSAGSTGEVSPDVLLGVSFSQEKESAG